MRIMNIVTLRHETYGIAEGEGVKRLHLWMIRIRILPSYSGIWIPDWSGIQVMGTGHGYSDVFVYKCAVFRSSLYLQNSKFYNIEKVTYISVFDPNSEQVRHSDPTCIVPFNKNNTWRLIYSNFPSKIKMKFEKYIYEVIVIKWHAINARALGDH